MVDPMIFDKVLFDRVRAVVQLSEDARAEEKAFDKAYAVALPEIEHALRQIHEAPTLHNCSSLNYGDVPGKGRDTARGIEFVRIGTHPINLKCHFYPESAQRKVVFQVESAAVPVQTTLSVDELSRSTVLDLVLDQVEKAVRSSAFMPAKGQK